MNETEFDLYVLARPGRRDLLEQTIEAVQRGPNRKPSRILAVSLDGEPGMLDGRALMGFAPEGIPVLKTFTGDQREEIYREFLRWGLSKFAASPSYAAIDAGSTLANTGEFLCDDLFNFCDYRMHNWLFGTYPAPGGRILADSVLFDRAIVAEILARIEMRYGNIRWYDAVLNILKAVPRTKFCAAQSYADYVDTFPAGQISRRMVPTQRVKSERPVLRMSTLGVNGRFGNQVFQYAFLRLFAREHGLEAQAPQWIGSALFGHRDSFGTDSLPLWHEKNGVMPAEMNCRDETPASHEIWGHFQYHTSFYRERREEFQSLFVPAEPIRAPLQQAVDRICAQGRTLVAIHVRRGDYQGGLFWPAPAQWYVRWLQRIWPTLDKPILYIASDEPEKVAGDFAAFSPKTAAHLGVNLKGAEFYPDFFVLSRCDLLAISNSTFSYAAAMLNDTARLFVRPDPDLEAMAEFDPWNSHPLLERKKRAA